MFDIVCFCPQQIEKILKQKHLESQLCEAKLAQQMVAAAEEKESSMAERQYVSQPCIQFVCVC